MAARRIQGYLPGRAIVGFWGLFEEDFGDPFTPEPYPVVAPSRAGSAILPFACPHCGQTIDFSDPTRREHYHDQRQTGRGRSFIQHNNYWCPHCRKRFRLDFQGKVPGKIVLGGVGPSKVTRFSVVGGKIRSEVSVSQPKSQSFLGRLLDRVLPKTSHLHGVDVLGAGATSDEALPIFIPNPPFDHVGHVLGDDVHADAMAQLDPTNTDAPILNSQEFADAAAAIDAADGGGVDGGGFMSSTDADGFADPFAAADQGDGGFGGGGDSTASDAESALDAAQQGGSGGGDAGMSPDGGAGGGAGPSSSDLSQATQDAGSATALSDAEIQAQLTVNTGAGHFSSRGDDSVVGVTSLAQGQAVLSKVQMAGKRALDLGRKAVAAGNVKAGQAAVAAGQRAMTSAGKLQTVLQKNMARAKAAQGKTSAPGRSASKPSRAAQGALSSGRVAPQQVVRTGVRRIVR